MYVRKTKKKEKRAKEGTQTITKDSKTMESGHLDDKGKEIVDDGVEELVNESTP